MVLESLKNNFEIDYYVNQISNTQQIRNQILNIFDSYQDPEYSEKLHRVIPGAGKTWGVQLPILKILARKIGTIVCNHPDEGEELLCNFWDADTREERKIAAEAIAYLFVREPEIALKTMIKWLCDINNWEICDTLALYGFKPYVLSNPEKVVIMIKSWIRSPNPWIRRFAVVSMIPLARQKNVNQKMDRYLILLKLVMEDSDIYVQKAAAWLLREITAIDHDRVGKFLEIFAKQKESTSWRIVKEGSKKLSGEIWDEIHDK